MADVARSAEDVFDYCTDHTHEPEWNVKMKYVRKLSDGTARVIGLSASVQFESKK